MPIVAKRKLTRPCSSTDEVIAVMKTVRGAIVSQFDVSSYERVALTGPQGEVEGFDLHAAVDEAATGGLVPTMARWHMYEPGPVADATFSVSIHDFHDLSRSAHITVSGPDLGRVLAAEETLKRVFAQEDAELARVQAGQEAERRRNGALQRFWREQNGPLIVTLVGAVLATISAFIVGRLT